MGRILEFWNDGKKRGIIYQLVFFSLVFLSLFFLIENTIVNMQKRGIESGFGFLQNTAGFTIIQTFLPFDEDSSYLMAYATSLLNTLLISVSGIIVASSIGFLVGIFSLSKNFLLRSLAICYVETFRNIPLLLQIFFWYHAVLKPLSPPSEIYKQGDLLFFGFNNRGLFFPEIVLGGNMLWVFIAFFAGVLITVSYKRHAKIVQIRTGQQLPVMAVSSVIVLFPAIAFLFVFLFSATSQVTFLPAEMGRFQLSGGSKIIPEFISLFLALSIYTASFIAEVVRAGIQSVNRGQTEAANSLGFKDKHILRLIIIPQALRVIIPPLTNQYLNLTKNSSLATAIAYPDLVSVFAGTVLSQSGQALVIMGMTLFTYLTFSLLTSFFMNWYNSKNLIKER